MQDLLLIAVLTAFPIIIGYAIYMNDKQRIYELLHSRGSTDITIAKAWFQGGRNHNVYDVTFTDKNRRHCRNRCLIRSGLFYEGPIYWEYDISD
jgi:hypothetical protein